MSFKYRMRACCLACCAAAIAALGALSLAPAAGATTLGGTYLALGDSLTYGYHQAQFFEELKKGEVNPASFDEGYVDDFSAALKLANPTYRSSMTAARARRAKRSSKARDSPAYCAGGPTGTPFPYSFLHHPYTKGSQLADALAILENNHNVSPISLDIGANDVLQFIEHTCGFPATYTCSEKQVTAEYEHIAANVGSILAQLRAAAPHAQIVVIGNYNPYPTVLPPPGGDKELAQLNGILAATTAKVERARASPAWSPRSTRRASSADRKAATFPRSASSRRCAQVARSTRLAPKLTFTPRSSATR